MKKSFSLLSIVAMFGFSCSKNVVYDSAAKKTAVSVEESAIVFDENSQVRSTKAEAGALVALAPIAIDLAFKITDSFLKGNVKKFSAEYVAQQSYIGKADVIPSFSFIKRVNGELALKITFVARDVVKGQSMVYYVKDIELRYSKAKIKNKNSLVDKVDYSIEIKPTFITDGKKVSQELAPISIKSVAPGAAIDFATSDSKNPLTADEFRYRTNLIMLPQNSTLAEINLKIVETNPRKVKAEKILETFNSYKDDAKTVINNFIGDDKKKTDDSGTPAGGNGGQQPETPANGGEEQPGQGARPESGRRTPTPSDSAENLNAVLPDRN